MSIAAVVPWIGPKKHMAEKSSTKRETLPEMAGC